MQKVLAVRVDGLGLSTRVQNVLDGMQVVTLGDLVSLSDRDLPVLPTWDARASGKSIRCSGRTGFLSA